MADSSPVPPNPFARYSLVRTCDVAEAMRKYMAYEQQKRLERVARVTDVHAWFAEPPPEGEKSALPAKVQ